MDVIVMHKTTRQMPLQIRQKHIDRIQEHCDHVHWFETEEELLKSGVDAEVLFAWGGTEEAPETFCNRSRRLKWFNSFSAGVDPLMRSSVKDLPIVITNASGIHGKPMGLTALGYIIAALRNFKYFYKNQSEKVWSKSDRLPEEAEGKVLAIVGAGAIAKSVAEYAKAIEMYVIGVKRTVEEMENFDEVRRNTELNHVLERSDFIVLLTPLTEETFHLFNDERFSHVKKGAHFINISRGQNVDTGALVRALENGTLSGCTLDAVDPEPLNADSPLWDMDNVFITPHTSAVSPLYVDRAVEQFVTNIENFKSGKPMFNVIDVKKYT